MQRASTRLRFMREAEADDRPHRLEHEPFPPVLAGEDVAQLGAGVLWRVAHVHAAGADERAAALEDYAPAAEFSPLGVLHQGVGLPEDVARNLGVRGVGEHGLRVVEAHLA